MKKILTLALFLTSSVMFVSSADAKTNNGLTAANANEPQIKIQIGKGRRNRRVRTVTRTRVVRQGFRTFRETYRITYFPNGRTSTQVISRVRVR